MGWIAALLALAFGGLAAERYEPSLGASLRERWRWTEVEALSGFEFLFACEAPDGVVWLASKGEVGRYDGFELERIPIGEGRWALDVYVARDGTVYLLTNKGVMRVEGQELVPLRDRRGRPIWSRFVAEDQEGGVWMGGGPGLWRLKAGEQRQFRLGLEGVFSAVVDRNGMIWVTEMGDPTIKVFDPSGEGGARLAYQFERRNPTDRCHLRLDTKGRIWALGASEKGENFIYENYEQRVGASGLDDLYLTNTYGMRMAELADGRTFLCVARRIAEVADGETMVLAADDYPIPTSALFCIALQGDRLLIGGRESKVYSIDLSNERWTTYRRLNFQCEDAAGARWFLEHDGRLVTDGGDGGTWLAFGEEDGIIAEPNRAFFGSDGVLWVSGGHRGAAAVSRRKDGVWTRMDFPDAGSTFSHLGALEASDGSVLFGVGEVEESAAESVGGAVVFRERDGVLEGGLVPPPVFPRRSEVIVERKSDGFWFGGDMLSHRKGDGTLVPNQVELFAHPQWFDHIALDRDQALWVAVWGKGVYRFDGESWDLHSEADGLPSNEATYILAGGLGEGVLVATSEGLSRFDGRSWSNWGTGFGGKFRRESHSLREGSDGSLWINHAYRQWLVRGKMEEEKADSFLSFRYRKNARGPRTEIVRGAARLPEGSPVLVEWKGSDAWSETPSEELEFSWRLGTGDWSAYSRKTSVALDGVGSGKYTFEVRARDSDWNVDPTPASQAFAVIPPVWKRPWFALLAVAVIGVIAFLVNALFKARVKSAMAMEEFKLDFFTNISHELRNPLAVIVGPLESLLADEKSQKSRQLMQIALRNARKMQGLITQLLQFRKLELGKSPLRVSSGELIGFLNEAVALHEPLWKAKGQTLAVASNQAYWVCGYDADKLQKIADNLVSNAIKFTGEGGEIGVRFDVDLADGHWLLRFVVEDDGPGIPPEEIEFVHKPFYRVRSEKGQVDGFGIGLALVGELVQVWGGELVFESPINQKGGGTRATALLPLTAERVESVGSEDLDEEDEPELGEEKRPALLLVEDNEDLRFFMKEELSERYEIAEAANGRAALEAAVEREFDLIVTDVMMPEMDGFELCRRVRADPRTSHVPIIILTAKSSEEHSVEGVEAGADAYFAKPLNMARLRVQIAGLLEARRTLRLKFAQQLVIQPSELTLVSSDQVVLEKAIKIVESHLDDPDFGVDQFAKEMAMGRTTLFRKLKALTGQAPNPFIRSMRMKRAAQLLKSGEFTVSETLAYVGIADLSYFSRAFKKEFGVSPSHYGSKSAGSQ